MAGLLDLPDSNQGLLGGLFGSAADPGSLYGGLLTPQQNQALNYRGLLAAAGALGQAAMPSRMPIPIGAALGSAAGAMGTAQDAAALNAMRGSLLGLQGKELGLKYAMQQNALQQNAAIQKQFFGGDAGSAPATGGNGGGEVGSSTPNAKVSDGGIGAGQLYSFLTENGATPNEATMLTSAANAESSFRPDITHDGGIGYGLFGHNTDRLAAMRQFAGVGPNDPVPWQKQALFALQELHGSESKAGGMVNAATTPEQLTDAQLAFERPNLNIAGGNRAQRLASTTQYFNSPPGAKPTQLAQADTGTATDAVPQSGGTGLPPRIGLSGNGPNAQLINLDTGTPLNLTSQPPAAPASAAPQGLLDRLNAASSSAAPPASLLPPQMAAAPQAAPSMLPPTPPTATPFTNAPPVNGIGAPAPGPQSSMLSPQPPQMPQPSMMPSAAPPAALGPTPGGLDLYTRRMLGLEMMNANMGIAGLGTPYQGMVGVLGGAPQYKAAQDLAAANARNTSDLAFAPQIAQAKDRAVIKDSRQGGAGFQFNPQTGQWEVAFQNPRLPEGTSLSVGPNGDLVAKEVPGALPAIQGAAQAQHAGANVANLSPTNPMGGPSPDTQPTPSAYGMLPPLSEQKLPASAAEAEHAIPEFRKKITEWTDAAAPAQQAEMRLIASWKALQAIQSGAWTTLKADLVAGLKGAGINVPDNIMDADPAKAQIVIHEGVLSTIPILKAGTPRFAQSEFNKVSEALQQPDLQPEANQQIMAEGIALSRQSQNLPNAFKASQWQDPQGFETSYLAHNNLTNQAAQVKAELGPLKGMPGNTTTKQTVGEGTIVTGPNGQRLQNRGGQWLDLGTLKPYQPAQ